MKIVSIVTSFPRDERDVLIPWIIRLIKLLKQKDINTEVFTSSYRGLKDEVRDEIKVKRFRYFFKKWEKLSHDMSVPEKLKNSPCYFFILPFFMLFGIIAAYRFGKKSSFDIIHVHFPFPLALFGIAMKIASKKPMVVSCHGSEVNMAKKNRAFRTIFRWMLSYAEIITVNSSFMKEEVIKIVGKREVEVIPMGSGMDEISLKSFENKEKDEKKRILYVGRLIEWKGVEYLIKAFKFLESSKYELHIVGDGPERDRLEKGLTNEFYVTDFKIEFYGYLKGAALEDMYKNADVFVLPSIVDGKGYTEGLGTVLLEAISYGVPVIGSNVGGIPDIIVDGETGILVPEKDPEAIAKAIKKIVKNSELSKKLTTQARKVVSDKFSWELITEKFYILYKKLS